jgi:hypothetical protein
MHLDLVSSSTRPGNKKHPNISTMQILTPNDPPDWPRGNDRDVDKRSDSIPSLFSEFSLIHDRLVEQFRRADLVAIGIDSRIVRVDLFVLFITRRLRSCTALLPRSALRNLKPHLDELVGGSFGFDTGRGGDDGRRVEIEGDLVLACHVRVGDRGQGDLERDSLLNQES